MIIREIIKEIIRNPKSLKYFLPWIKSTIFKYQFGKIRLPWLTLSAINWLEDTIKPSWKVFEWGSGASTLYFSRKAKLIVSIEHDNKWYDQISEIIQHENICNLRYSLIPPVLSEHEKEFYKSSDNNYTNYSFVNYCKVIEKYSNNYFDLIVIDGRSRPGCIIHAIKKVKKNGYILLDDSERKEYQKGIAKLKKFNKQNYYGISLYSTLTKETTIWQKK